MEAFRYPKGGRIQFFLEGRGEDKKKVLKKNTFKNLLPSPPP